MKRLFSFRNIAAALAISALLDWLEWSLHHPPNMAVIAVIHFAIVLIALAIITWMTQRFRRRP